jgi:hypothetical protein
MLVIFTSKGQGDITMFGHVAEHLIGLMGHSGTIPSAIAAKDIPAALERLKKAIALEDPQDTEDSASDNIDEPVEPSVSIYNRAYPLMEMLTAATKEDSSVMWRKK